MLKVAGGAVLGALGKEWFERSKRRRRGADLRALFTAHAEALSSSAAFALEFNSTARNTSLRQHLSELLDVMSDPDFVTLAPDDNRARTQLLRSRDHLRKISEDLVAYPEQSEELVERMLRDLSIGVLRKRKRWRKPPPGTGYTTKLGEPITELRWYHLNRWKFAAADARRRRAKDGKDAQDAKDG